MQNSKPTSSSDRLGDVAKDQNTRTTAATRQQVCAASPGPSGSIPSPLSPMIERFIQDRNDFLQYWIANGGRLENIVSVEEERVGRASAETGLVCQEKARGPLHRDQKHYHT